MDKKRSQQYRTRIDQALATPKLQQALHQFGDAFLLARENAFSGHDFEELRSAIAEMKDDVRENLDGYLDEFCRNASEAGATIYYASTAEKAMRPVVKMRLRDRRSTHTPATGEARKTVPPWMKPTRPSRVRESVRLVTSHCSAANCA